MKMKGKAVHMSLVIVVAIFIFLGFRFYYAREAALERFQMYESRAKEVMTSYGKVSYIEEGSGEVILSCHGICGGYDQAYDTLSGKEDSYRILAPSRFGYPGSDMPDHPTIEKQAEAYVELLDTLNIEQTYILATSAGGTSAIKFALMYPERTKGLILYCSGYPKMQDPGKKVTYMGPPSILCHDFPMWLMSPLFKPLMGMEQNTIKVIMPLRDKHAGIVFDAKVTNTDMYNNYQNYDMTDLKVPVLIMHAKDDKLADFELVTQWAERTPNCTFVSFEGGGHMMEGNNGEIDAALEAFIQ